jgi:hypothetical protein
MSRRLLLLGLVAIGINVAAPVTAPAQLITGVGAAKTVHDANALTARIRAYHRGPGTWRGSGPPPPGYCGTMSAGEAVLQELARLANAAVANRQSGLARSLERVADRLSDELDEEEITNNLAGIPYQVFPCPVPASSYPARAYVLPAVERRMPFCRVQADALRVSFEPRRARIEQCLRPPGY